MSYQLPTQKNVVIEWESPEVEVETTCKELDTVEIDPREYINRYGSELRHTNELPICKNINRYLYNLTGHSSNANNSKSEATQAVNEYQPTLPERLCRKCGGGGSEYEFEVTESYPNVPPPKQFAGNFISATALSSSSSSKDCLVHFFQKYSAYNSKEDSKNAGAYDYEGDLAALNLIDLQRHNLMNLAKSARIEQKF